jgi:hypothetical protein
LKQKTVHVPAEYGTKATSSIYVFFQLKCGLLTTPPRAVSTEHGCLRPLPPQQQHQQLPVGKITIHRLAMGTDGDGVHGIWQLLYSFGGSFDAMVMARISVSRSPFWCALLASRNHCV